MRLARLLGVALAVLTSGSVSFAQCGEWEVGFAPPGEGLDDLVFPLAVLDAGAGSALHAGGAFTTAGGVAAERVAVWNGATWSTVGSPGTGPSDWVLSIAAFDDGLGLGLYVGGAFTSAGGAAAPYMAKWDGTSWSALGAPGSGMNGWVRALTVLDDGSGPVLIAGGEFTTAGGVVAPHIAKWNGTTWSALGPPGSGINGVVHALTVFDDGSGPALFAGGSFTTAGGVSASCVARWDGTSWSALGTPGNGVAGVVYSFAAFDDGSGPALYAGGDFTSAGGISTLRIARWNGTTWSALGAPGSGANGTIYSLAAHDDGSGPALYVGGNFSDAGGVSAGRIARWDGSAWSALGAPGSGMDVFVYSLAVFDDGSGPALFAGGGFFTAGGVPASHIARWNGSSWSALNGGGDGLSGGPIEALASFDDGSGPELFAGGQFFQAGTVPASRIARWDGAGWSALGSPGGGVNNPVQCLASFDDGSGPALYAGGQFTVAGGVAALRIARWNGTSWSAVGAPGTGLSSTVLCLAGFDDGAGAALYAGGDFLSGNGVGALRIARWNGIGWSAVGAPGSGMSSTVRALAVFDDGSGPALYAGGDFTSADGIPALRIARWNGSSWSALGAPGSGMNGRVRSLTVFDDGSGAALYAAGDFSMAGAVPALRIAKWNGSSWSALGAPGSGMSGTVHVLAVFDDGLGSALYAGGDFTSANGVPALRIARWKDSTWSALGAPGSGMSSSVYALAVFDDGADADADLYVGGAFASAGAIASSRIAEWHGCASVPVPYCLGDGGVAVCPCGNVGLPGRGCDNSAGTGGAQLSFSGTSSPDTLVLAQQGELPSSLSIFLQGSVQLAIPVVFGDGLRCTGGALKRLYVKTASAGSVSAPQAGDPSITTQSAALGDPLAPGATRFYQVYYRDPDLAFCPAPPGDGFNVGNALRVVW